MVRKAKDTDKLFRRCPVCSTPMAFSVDTDGVQTDLEHPAPQLPPTTWECPNCTHVDAVGADVEAKLERRPRLL